jgi:hypothetical protein
MHFDPILWGRKLLRNQYKVRDAGGIVAVHAVQRPGTNAKTHSDGDDDDDDEMLDQNPDVTLSTLLRSHHPSPGLTLSLYYNIRAEL